MQGRKMSSRIRSLLFGLLSIYLVVVLIMALFQRSFLFMPSHAPDESELSAWTRDGENLGYCRTVEPPRNVWLVLHGNAGQASRRAYIVRVLPKGDSVYVMEYPGFGNRPGKPSMASINAAAEEAYALLRSMHPGRPVCVLGESIGSGPASHLAAMPVAPDKIVLVVPFDNLASVAQGHYPFLPVRWLLLDRWDNVKALSGYKGRLEIFGTGGDNVIPVGHARRLAAECPSAVYHEIPGGHNDWSRNIAAIDNP
jgi:hypothetical protein